MSVLWLTANFGPASWAKARYADVIANALAISLEVVVSTDRGHMLGGWRLHHHVVMPGLRRSDAIGPLQEIVPLLALDIIQFGAAHSAVHAISLSDVDIFISLQENVLTRLWHGRR